MTLEFIISFSDIMLRNTKQLFFFKSLNYQNMLFLIWELIFSKLNSILPEQVNCI